MAAAQVLGRQSTGGLITAQDEDGGYPWAVFAGLVTKVTALDLAACLYSLLHGDLGVLRELRSSFWCGRWIAIGAWRRTAWGAPAAGAAVVGPPTLMSRRATQLVMIAGGCVIARTSSLALQAVIGRSACSTALGPSPRSWPACPVARRSSSSRASRVRS